MVCLLRDISLRCSIKDFTEENALIINNDFVLTEVEWSYQHICSHTVHTDITCKHVVVLLCVVIVLFFLLLLFFWPFRSVIRAQ